MATSLQLLDLPTDLRVHVLTCLSPADLLRAATTGHSFHTLHLQHGNDIWRRYVVESYKSVESVQWGAMQWRCVYTLLHGLGFSQPWGASPSSVNDVYWPVFRNYSTFETNMPLLLELDDDDPKRVELLSRSSTPGMSAFVDNYAFAMLQGLPLSEHGWEIQLDTFTTCQKGLLLGICVDTSWWGCSACRDSEGAAGACQCDEDTYLTVYGFDVGHCMWGFDTHLCHVNVHGWNEDLQDPVDANVGEHTMSDEQSPWDGHQILALTVRVAGERLELALSHTDSGTCYGRLVYEQLPPSQIESLSRGGGCVFVGVSTTDHDMRAELAIDRIEEYRASSLFLHRVAPML